MTERVQIGDHVLYLADNREVLADLPRAAAIVTDNPYGMGWDTDSTRFLGGKNPDTRRGAGRDDWGKIEGDKEPFDPEPWLAWPEIVLFGANHFARRLPVGTTIVWIKKQPHLYGSFLSDAEVIWQKGGRGVYVYYEPWSPPRRQEQSGLRDDRNVPRTAHPSQKPVGLMEWCIQRTKAGVIVDPYMGSGTTGIAAANMGRRFVGVERVRRHFETAVERIERMTRQQRLGAF